MHVQIIKIDHTPTIMHSISTYRMLWLDLGDLAEIKTAIPAHALDSPNFVDPPFGSYEHDNKKVIIGGMG